MAKIWTKEETFEWHCRKNGWTHVDPHGFCAYYDMIGWVNAKGKPLEGHWADALRAWEYILSGMCREDVEKLAFDDPRRMMWRDGEAMVRWEINGEPVYVEKALDEMMRGGAQACGMSPAEWVIDMARIACQEELKQIGDFSLVFHALKAKEAKSLWSMEVSDGDTEAVKDSERDGQAAAGN